MALWAATPAFAQLDLSQRLDAAEKKLDADIKACKPIDPKEYLPVRDEAFHNVRTALKAAASGVPIDSKKVDSEFKRAKALFDKAQAAANAPCPPKAQGQQPSQAPAPPTTVPQSPGQPAIQPTTDPLAEMRLEAFDLFEDLEVAIWSCDLDEIRKLIPELQDLANRARAAADAAKAAGTFSKYHASDFEKLATSLEDALAEAQGIRACPAPERPTSGGSHKPGTSVRPPPKPSTLNDLFNNEPGKPGPRTTPKLDIPPSGTLEPMGTGGGPNAPRFPNNGERSGTPAPPRYDILDDLVEPPSTGEVRAIDLRLRELRDAAKALKSAPGCDPKLWDAHIKHLGDLAKRARQMADWARTSGQTTGTDPTEAERVAKEAKRQLDEALALRAGDCPNARSEVIPRIEPLTQLPPYNIETGKPYSRIDWIAMRARWNLDDLDDAFYYCDEDWVDKIFPKLGGLIAETEAIIASGALSKEDAEDAADMLADLRAAGFAAALFYCPKLEGSKYVQVYLERLAKGQEGPGDLPAIMPAPGREADRLGEYQPAQTPTFEPMGATGGGMTFPTKPEPAAAANDAAREYDAIWNGVGFLMMGYFYNGPCDETHFRDYLAQLETFDKRAGALAEAVKEGGDLSAVPPAKVQRLSDDIKRHIAEAKQVLAVDCPAGVTFRMNPFDGSILALHNSERARVGALPVHWDPVLAAHSTVPAQDVLKAGQPQHSSREGRGIERENISMGLRGWGPERLAKKWLGEPLIAGRFPYVSATGNWADAGHKSQIDSINQTDLGCDWAAGGTFEVLVCHYSPGGNKDGQAIGFRDPANFMFGPIKFDPGYNSIRKEREPTNPDGLQFGDETVAAWNEYVSARVNCDVVVMDAAIKQLKTYGQAALEHSVEERGKGNQGAADAYNAMTRQIAERVQDAMLYLDDCKRHPFNFPQGGGSHNAAPPPPPPPPPSPPPPPPPP